MKTKILLLALFTACSTNAYGLDISARAACLFPQDKHIRGVYGHGIYVDYAIEVDYPLKEIFECGENFSNCYAWANLSYYYLHGRSYLSTPSSAEQTVTNFDSTDTTVPEIDSISSRDLTNSSKMQSWAFNVGMKKVFCLTCDPAFHPYIGLGVGVGHINYEDRSIFVKEDINRWGYTILAKLGIEYDLPCNFFLDLFVDYAFNYFGAPHSKRRIGTRPTNTGGFKAGLGLGYRF